MTTNNQSVNLSVEIFMCNLHKENYALNRPLAIHLEKDQIRPVGSIGNHNVREEKKKMVKDAVFVAWEPQESLIRQ